MKKGFADFLKRVQADIVGVQEVRALYEEIPDEAREPAGWHTAFVAGRAPGLQRRRHLQPGWRPSGWRPGSACPSSTWRAATSPRTSARSAGASPVVNAYFPKGDGKNRDNSRVPYKLDFYRAVFERVQRMRRRCPVLVIGDYNTAHREIDLARPKANVKNSGFLPVERAEIDRWLEAGWVDAFRALPSRRAGPLQLVDAAGRRARAQRRLADRLRDGLAGRDEAGGRRLHLARISSAPTTARWAWISTFSPDHGAVLSGRLLRQTRFIRERENTPTPAVYMDAPIWTPPRGKG